MNRWSALWVLIAWCQAPFQKRSKSDRLRSNHMSLVRRTHSMYDDHDQLIDKENTKSSILLLPESWYKALIGKFINETGWSGLHVKCPADDIYTLCHNGRHGNVIYVCRSRASQPVQHTNSVIHRKTQFGHAMIDRYVHVFNFTEYYHVKVYRRIYASLGVNELISLVWYKFIPWPNQQLTLFFHLAVWQLAPIIISKLSCFIIEHEWPGSQCLTQCPLGDFNKFLEK